MAEPLKNLFGGEVVRRLSAEIGRVHSPFDRKAFERDALAGFEGLELLDRGRHLARALKSHLPADFGSAVDVLLATLPADRDAAGGMAAFFYLPHTEFVKSFGLAHFEHSMRALYALTQHFTGEFAMRPFLEHHQDATMERLARWTSDPREHVRRLVSESTRTRLPWAPRLREFQRNPAPVLALLERLRDDPALYVRRSVANNLNDIGKDHPRLLVETARDWLVGATADRRWIISHALRSSVKRGDPDALALLGYGAKGRFEVVSASISPSRPVMGTRVTITCTIRNPSRRSSQVMVDMRVHFVKANGGTSAKVFKISAVDLAAGASVAMRKTVSLADLTTRKHYPGVHRVELQLNGVIAPVGHFTLLAAAGRKRSASA